MNTRRCAVCCLTWIVPSCIVLWYFSAVLQDSEPNERIGEVDCPALRAARGEDLSLAADYREHPVSLTRTAGLERCVTSDQLFLALRSSLPLWHPPTVPSLIHELKLWGLDAYFSEEVVGRHRSGTQMRDALLSDKCCRETTTPTGGSFLVNSPYGIHVVCAGSQDAVGNRSEGHYGQLLMVLGEVGVPLQSQVVTVSGRTGTVADVLRDATMRFTWTRELEFIGCALALWLPPRRSWTNQFGDSFCFDQLVEHLTAKPFGDGSCGGCHTAYAVAVILNVDSEIAVLSDKYRSRAEEWLARLSRLLEHTERPEGGWDRYWAGTDPGIMYDDAVLDRLTVIGHHLEWMPFVPSALRPRNDVIARAVSAYTHDVEQLPPIATRSFKSLLPCSHGARALCLMSGDAPYSKWSEFWAAGRLIRGERGYELK